MVSGQLYFHHQLGIEIEVFSTAIGDVSAWIANYTSTVRLVVHVVVGVPVNPHIHFPEQITQFRRETRGEHTVLEAICHRLCGRQVVRDHDCLAIEGGFKSFLHPDQ